MADRINPSDDEPTLDPAIVGYLQCQLVSRVVVWNQPEIPGVLVQTEYIPDGGTTPFVRTRLALSYIQAKVLGEMLLREAENSSD